MEPQKYNDLGFGTKTSGLGRGLNKDGSFNVKKINIPFTERVNFYHALVTMSWTKFFFTVFFTFLIVNLLFAGIYVLIGLEHLTGIEGKSEADRFLDAFFFSSQTLTTLGYGRIAPVGTWASLAAAIESMLGLLTYALATGLMYGRFSKPIAKIKYSHHAVIAPYKDINGFMFRVLNPKDSQLIEIEVSLTLSILNTDSNLRNYYGLKLEREKINFFPSTWTVVHPIVENSPLHGLSQKDFMEKDVEVIVLIKAFDEIFSQTVYSRSSYRANEIKWGEKFSYIIQQAGAEVIVDVGKMDETEKAALN